MGLLRTFVFWWENELSKYKYNNSSGFVVGLWGSLCMVFRRAGRLWASFTSWQVGF